MSQFAEQSGSNVQEIVFAGAGCGNPANADRVRKAIEAHYHAEEVVVESDLAGACRLLSRRQPCLTAILGTGAAACQYDGSRITEQAPSLGWMLGDEGSGTHLGKLLISQYLKGGLPPECREALEREFGLDRSEVLRRVYRAPSPNLFFSSFAKFIHHKINEYPELQILVKNSFNQFLQEQILPLSGHNTLPLHLMGSVAWHYRPFLEEAAHQHNVTIGQVAASPLQLIRGCDVETR
jgi:N-acetylglucosamine kinase-like BadF-type ATPase